VNPVLERLRSQRAEQISAMDAVLGQVDDRDLVDAERSLLTASQQRIGELDAQIAPLAEYENLRQAHADASRLPSGQALQLAPKRVDGVERGIEYRSAGHFLVDLIRARGIMDRGMVDTEAQARITRVVADQKTTDTTGLLPTPIVGQVVSLIDANRPLITSLGGAMALGAIPGATFTRPKITVHTSVAAQAGEKTQLSSTKMTITGLPFSKQTYGGTVDISRQDIDWTSPSAWDILVRDLAEVYAVQTETAVAADFKTKATGTAVSVGTAATAISLSQWTTGLYTAAMHAYQASKRMPDRIWCSLDVWAALGALVDTTRVVLPVDTTREMGAPGTSNLADFAGDLFGLPRIVVPTFASGTCIVGASSLYEVYEEVVGLLSVIEPSILGIQVAYGGYVAFNTLDGASFVPLTIVGTLPTVAEAAQASPRK
jgi:HK97 family phage major capsid protein